MPSAKTVVPPLVVMGVQGSGKSTSGRAIAEFLSLPFIDGDDLHPAANKDKMASGHPLTDADREPWLEAIGQALAEGLARGESTVIACSALKRRYRDLIRSFAPGTRFVHLTGERTLIAERLTHRDHEYMPPTLLDSQFDTLEPLEADEAGIPVDINLTPARIAQAVSEALTAAGR